MKNIDINPPCPILDRDYQIHSHLVTLLACWCSSGRIRSVVVGKMMPICIFWSIWRERNNRCFEDLESSIEGILASLLYSLY
jgi:hypothetical protein